MQSLSENSHRSVGHLALWTVKLLTNPNIMHLVTRDQNLFAAAYAALQPYFNEKMVPVPESTPSAKMREEIRENMKDLERRYGENINSGYNALDIKARLLFEEYNEKGDWTKWEKFLKDAKAEAERTYNKVHTSVEYNIDFLAGILDLNDTQCDLLEFQVLRTDNTFDIFYTRLFNYASQHKVFTKFVFETIFDDFDYIELSPESVLVKSCLISYNPHTGILSKMPVSLANMFTHFEGGDQLSFFKQIVRPMEKKPSPYGALGSLAEPDKQIIVNLFNNTVNNPESKAINVLAYGLNSLDKKTAVYNTLKDAGFEIYVLNTRGVNRADLGPRTYIAQRFLESITTGIVRAKPILIIEQAEEILYRRQSFDFLLGGFMDKNDDNETEHLENDGVLLEENPVPSFWITNNPQALREENVGRFLYHCEIKSASRADRKNQIETILSELDLGPEVEQYLSKYHQVSPKQVKSASQLAQLVAEEKDNQVEILKRAIHHSQRALGRSAMEEIKESVTKYSLDYINLNSEYDLEQVIKSLKSRPQGTLCFYGIPGAGKTQFAEYLAIQLDLPIVKKKASDLLSKWVGDNEQNIAAMFDEAKEAGGILFLDEADSFLKDRSEARDNWSVSLTNELLQGMERFDGIFICATNLFEKIDPASLRRFTFKFEFLAMTEEQRWKMFQAECLEGQVETYDMEELDNFKRRLDKIQNLAPGDFATLRRQENVLAIKLAPKQFLAQLEEEVEAKLFGLTKNPIGFSKK